MKKFVVSSSWSTAIGAVFIAAFALVGCGDDSSASAGPNDEPISVENSSSSKKLSSSESQVNSSSSRVSSSSLAPGAVDPAAIVMGEMTDSRDGKKYKTVTIGYQTWMAENLNFAYTSALYNYDDYTSDSTSWCYDNEPVNCSKYGRLYTWAAAVGKSESECGHFYKCNLPSSKTRGICPVDWHLPDTTEWRRLFSAVGGKSTAGKMLKSTSGWANSWGDDDGTDTYAFSALPAGLRDYYGNYSYEVGFADFWSSTEDGGSGAYYITLRWDDSKADRLSYYKYFGLSVRCVRNY